MRRGALWGKAGDRGVEALKWIYALDREVRAQSDATSIVEDATERIQSFDALRALWRA